ncbi:MAG: peptidylprolyl isomerase [Planctomycetota bacterium]|nr:peptidylprolyl isomerase [Planctomycetota bacterium]
MKEFPWLRVDGVDVTTTDFVRALKRTGQWDRILQEVVNDRFVREEASRRGIQVSDDELQKLSDTVRRQLDLHDATATHAWLKSRHLSVEDWEEALEQDLLSRRLVFAIYGENIVETRFAETIDRYSRVCLSRLCCDDEGRIDEIAEQIRRGEAAFSSLARRYSSDERTQELGGQMGWVLLSDLPAQLRSAIDGSSGKGELVGPLNTSEGWVLLRVEGVHAATLEEWIREEILADLLAEWVLQEGTNRPTELLV